MGKTKKIYKIAVMKLVKELTLQGITVIISLHDLNIAAQYSDIIYLLSNGRVFASGVPASILNKENLEKVYETKVDIIKNNNLPFIIPDCEN